MINQPDNDLPCSDYRSPGIFNSSSRKGGSNVVCLIQALEQTAAQIRKYLDRSETDAVGDKLECYSDDPRVDDLKLVKSNSSALIKFRTVLAQRSLALEYINWEIKNFGTSRVVDLVDNPRRSRARRCGKIERYVKANRDRFVNSETVRAGIERGIKLLVLENITNTVMTSVIISFCPSKFRSIKFDQLRSLGTMLDEMKWVGTLADKKTEWFQKCQKRYDGTFIDAFNFIVADFVQNG